MADKAIEVLLNEKRTFPPPKEFKKSANFRSATVFNAARKILKPSGRRRPKSCTGSSHGKKVLEWKTPWAKVVHRTEDPRVPRQDRHVKRLEDLTDLPCFTISM
jgi:hypothetical protein